MSIEVSTYCTKIILPALVSKSAFQLGSLSAIFSTMGCACALVILWGERGTPRYLHGNSEIWHGRDSCKNELSSSVHCMGRTLLFWRLVVSPEALPKSCRISRVIAISLAEGLKKSTTSSAYKEILCCNALLASGCNICSSAAFLIKWQSTSMTRMKSMGDNGSPCLRPRWWCILSPGDPLSSTWVEDVRSSPLMISHQIGPKPNCFKTSKRKGHETESKALLISNWEEYEPVSDCVGIL